jgi:hypothetical protein
LGKLHEQIAEERKVAAALYAAIKRHAEHEDDVSQNDRLLYEEADAIMEPGEGPHAAG